MNWSEIIPYILTALGGGGLASLFTYRISTRQQDENDFKSLVDRYITMVDKLEARVEILQQEIQNLREDRQKQDLLIQNLKNQLLIFESSHIDIPLPMWMKDTEGKMIFANNCYEDQFLTPRGYSLHDYIGNDDYSVWSDHIAANFRANDLRVIRSKKHIRSIEQVEDGLGNIYYVDVLKYPRMLENNVIGISGLIMGTSDTKKELE